MTRWVLMAAVAAVALAGLGGCEREPAPPTTVDEMPGQPDGMRRPPGAPGAPGMERPDATGVDDDMMGPGVGRPMGAPGAPGAPQEPDAAPMDRLPAEDWPAPRDTMDMDDAGAAAEPDAEVYSTPAGEEINK